MISAPADRRFRRAHIKPARRRRGWQRFTRPVVRSIAIALGLGCALYFGSEAIAHGRMLEINRIVVQGNERLSTGEVLSLLGGLRGQSLLWTDLDSWRHQLLASPWVRDAALRRSLPSTVEVLIGERRPLAIARKDAELFLIDEGGFVIDEYGPQYADLDLPIVDGLSGTPEGGDETRLQLLSRVLTAVRSRPAVARRLSQVDVSDSHNAAVILNGDTAIVYLGEEQFLPRLQSYLELMSALRERVSEIDYVDLRFDDRIYVRPADSLKPAASQQRDTSR